VTIETLKVKAQINITSSVTAEQASSVWSAPLPFDHESLMPARQPGVPNVSLADEGLNGFWSGTSGRGRFIDVDTGHTTSNFYRQVW
tara:strand:- start:70 stop:330 length:261 start_codon:yes stop_codon:yes gene_type:complete